MLCTTELVVQIRPREFQSFSIMEAKVVGSITFNVPVGFEIDVSNPKLTHNDKRIQLEFPMRRKHRDVVSSDWGKQIEVSNDKLLQPSYWNVRFFAGFVPVEGSEFSVVASDDKGYISSWRTARIIDDRPQNPVTVAIGDFKVATADAVIVPGADTLIVEVPIIQEPKYRDVTEADIGGMVEVKDRNHAEWVVRKLIWIEKDDRFPFFTISGAGPGVSVWEQARIVDKGPKLEWPKKSMCTNCGQLHPF